MAGKQKKIEKEFLLTDNSVNSYGFRLLTEGCLIDEYKKNPIGYGMHRRDDGVLVRWEDFRLEGDKLYAKPVINLSHAMGQRTVDEIENGFLNAASVGHIVVIEMSEEASLKLDGQTGPTITKWFNRECSLVDVPGNFNALVKLYSISSSGIEKEINLADFTTKNLNPTMEKYTLNAAQIAAMNLKANATEVEAGAAFNDLVAKAAKAEKLQGEINDLNAQVCKDKVESLLTAALAAKKLTQPLADKLKVDYATNPTGLKNLIDAMPAATSTEGEVAKILSVALAAKKITQEMSNKLAIDYKDKADELKNLVDAMPDYKGITGQLNGGGAVGSEKRIADLSAKSFDDLMESGESEELAKLAPEVWKEKKKTATAE